MLKTIILSFFALLLLIPILFVAPISISKKGKTILILLSFFLAFIGILANTVFYLWQTVAILLLLAILCSFLVIKRFESILFLEGKEKHRFVMDIPITESSEVAVPNRELAGHQIWQTKHASLPEEDADIHEPVIRKEDVVPLDPIPEQFEQQNEFSHEKVEEDAEHLEIEEFFKNRKILHSDNQNKIDDFQDEIKEERTYLDHAFAEDQNKDDANDEIPEEDDDFIIKEIDFDKKNRNL